MQRLRNHIIRRWPHVVLGIRPKWLRGLLFSDSDIRTAIITQAINTPEGRAKLAEALVAPICRRLDYESVGRQAFVVTPLEP